MSLLAYQPVLSDQDKRAIYDLYGQKGLDADWQVNCFTYCFYLHILHSSHTAGNCTRPNSLLPNEWVSWQFASSLLRSTLHSIWSMFSEPEICACYWTASVWISKIIFCLQQVIARQRTQAEVHCQHKFLIHWSV